MITSLERSFASLRRFIDACGFPAALVGGMAITARVRMRATDDLDLVIAVPSGATDKLLATASACGYRYDEATAREWVDSGLLRMTDAEGTTVDLLIATDPLSQALVQRATAERLMGSDVPVATVEDLLLMKLEANRPVDLDDAIAIKDAFGDRLDRAYVDKWAMALGLTDRLKALLD